MRDNNESYRRSLRTGSLLPPERSLYFRIGDACLYLLTALCAIALFRSGGTVCPVTRRCSLQKWR